MKPFLAPSKPCSICGHAIEARNNEFSECSHVDCRQRPRWANPLPFDTRPMRDDSPRGMFVTRQVAALFDSPERRVAR